LRARSAGLPTVRGISKHGLNHRLELRELQTADNGTNEESAMLHVRTSSGSGRQGGAVAHLPSRQGTLPKDSRTYTSWQPLDG
jgi:hypothetical protein